MRTTPKVVAGRASVEFDAMMDPKLTPRSVGSLEAMSYEYSSSIVLTEGEAEALRKHLGFRQFVVLPQSKPFEIRMRFDVFGHRSEWPEDVTISLRPHLLVSMHVGTPEQRSELLEFVRLLLDTMGHQQPMEEA